MQAVGVRDFGAADSLEPMSIETAEPGPGEARVRIAYAGVNFIDVYMRAGVYKRSDTYKTPLPMVLGMEGSGVVDAVGPDVGDVRPGDRVAYCLSRGSYAQSAIVPAWRLVKVPDDIGFDIATALMLQGCTAHYLSHSAYAVKPGDWCLVHAASGGVGQLLVQNAVRRGGRVIATCGAPDKAEIARSHGAEVVVLYRDEDFLDVVMSATSGAGVAVAYDSVGADTIDRSIRAVRRRGLCVLFGASSGVVDAVEPLALAEAGSIFFTRPHLADYMASADEIRGRAHDLFAAVRDGALKVAIDRVLPLAAAADAHRLLEARATRGKILLQADA